jgi:hypothetical protein
MIEWNFANTYYLAAIISSLIALVIYYLLTRKK